MLSKCFPASCSYFLWPGKFPPRCTKVFTVLPNSQLFGKFCYFLKTDLTSFRNLSDHLSCWGCEDGAPLSCLTYSGELQLPQRIRSTNPQKGHCTSTVPCQGGSKEGLSITLFTYPWCAVAVPPRTAYKSGV